MVYSSSFRRSKYYLLGARNPMAWHEFLRKKSDHTYLLTLNHNLDLGSFTSWLLRLSIHVDSYKCFCQFARVHLSLGGCVYTSLEFTCALISNGISNFFHNSKNLFFQFNFLSYLFWAKKKMSAVTFKLVKFIQFL